MAELTETVTRTVNCPYCQASAVMKNWKSSGGKQRYKCKPCGKRFPDTGAVGHKNPSNNVSAAISLFYRRMSYRQPAGRSVQMPVD